MSPKTPRTVALMGTRKATHLAKGALGKAHDALAGVEARLTKRIDAGARASVTPDELLATRFAAFRPLHAAPPEPGQRPSVTVFGFFNSSGFFGGIATLLNFSATVANQLDYDLRLVHTTSFEGDPDVAGFLKNQGIDVDPSRIHFVNAAHRRAAGASIPLHPDDLLVVSAWWDAFAVDRLAHERSYVYLIQDYEPIFYNNGDQQLWSSSTYESSKFVPVLNSSILHDYFQTTTHRRVAAEALVFEPAVRVPQRESMVAERPGKKRLFFYARPETDRNLFYTGLLAIDKAFEESAELRDNWDVWLGGTHTIPPLRLTSGLELQRLGKMSFEDYQQFTLTADLAVSSMLAPHPNYPTLEFSRLGTPVITTSWETKTDLDRYSEMITLVEPTVSAMSGAIIRCATAGPSETNAAPKTTDSWPDALAETAAAVATLHRGAVR
ncbi:MAG: rhamnosyltransferase WsaF family glycosyltransferase [Pseudoclavibacter sp.]